MNSSRMPVTQTSGHYGAKERMDLLHREQPPSFVGRHSEVILSVAAHWTTYRDLGDIHLYDSAVFCPFTT
jgi:hypothetical protein